jgi:3-phenylpropionate/trans-cinnamate dioxygenase ferredoxin component
MPEFVTVATTDELAPGERIIIEVKDHYVAVFQVGDRYFAIEDVCTHDDGPVAEGELEGTIIECPRHGARFDITTGAVVSMPATKPVPRYEVRVQDQEIQIMI